MTKSRKVEFPGATGAQLAARLDRPAEPRAFALFAHCFTCGKDIFAASRIAGALAARDIAVLRFDFTGIGSSEGEFSNTNFSSNVGDLVAAADYLRRNHGPPSLLIGHSLGGAAVLAAAPQVSDATAVVTIGAPASAAHVTHTFAADLADIVEKGTADVTLAGRTFTITSYWLRVSGVAGLGERERSSEDPGVPPRCDDFVILLVGSRNFVIPEPCGVTSAPPQCGTQRRQTLAEMA